MSYQTRNIFTEKNSLIAPWIEQISSSMQHFTWARKDVEVFTPHWVLRNLYFSRVSWTTLKYGNLPGKKREKITRKPTLHTFIYKPYMEFKMDLNTLFVLYYRSFYLSLLL